MIKNAVKTIKVIKILINTALLDKADNLIEENTKSMELNFQ